MSERKPVVVTSSVVAALEEYKGVKAELGIDVSSFEFDKGARGKGFAVYQGDRVVFTFETKEDALNHFSTYVKVAREVLSSPNVTVVEHATEEQINAAVDAGESETKTTRRKAA